MLCVLLPGAVDSQPAGRPPGPATITSGCNWSLGPPPRGNSVTTPLVVTRAIAEPRLADSTNQTLPSGPATIPLGALSGVGIGNSVSAPDGVIRPIRLAQNSLHHRLPAGPLAM